MQSVIALGLQWRKPAALVSALCLASLGLSACQALPQAATVASGDSQSTPAAAPSTDPSVANPALWPAGQSPIARDEALEARISALLATMTVEEKVGQIVQGDIGSITPDDVRKYRLGSVLAGGNSDPGRRYNARRPEWLALADAF